MLPTQWFTNLACFEMVSDWKQSVWKVNWSKWHERGKKKKISHPQELNPWPPEHRAVALSTAWATRTHGEQDLLTGVLHTATISIVTVIASVINEGGHGFDSCGWLRVFFCHTLLPFWSAHFSHFINELKINHLYSFIIRNNQQDYTAEANSTCPQGYAELLFSLAQ